MPLSKLLKRGDKITAIITSWNGEGMFEHYVVKARVTWTGRGLINYNSSPTGRSLRRRDEGKTWARGWEGEDADADANELRKASALKGEARAIEQERQKVLSEVQRSKRVLK